MPTSNDICLNCAGTGTTNNRQECLACGGQGTFAPLNIDAIQRYLLNDSEFCSEPPQESDDESFDTRALYVWKRARSLAGKPSDPEPLIRILVSGDPYQDELDNLAAQLAIDYLVEAA